MTHWIWDGYDPGAGYAFAEEQEGLPPETLHHVLVGTPLEEPLPELRVTALSPGKLPGVMASAFYARLVSEALRGVIEARVPDGVQYLPAVLKGKRAKYFVVHPTTRVAALDRKKSKLETYPDSETVHRVRKLVLRKVPAGAPALFHLEEIPQLVLVDDALRKALEEASPSAGVFQSPDEYRLGFFDDEDEE